MGALHAGHASLIDAARSEVEMVTASVFVNPLQFGALADLTAYPRTLDADGALLKAHGCDLLFAPSVAEMYPHHPEPEATTVHVTGPALGFEGSDRPGHFDGMATVVTLLFNLAGPCRAYFVEKDFQQLAVVRQMVADLGQQVVVVGCPTARESDGLAMSSRNKYLDERQRHAAPAIYKAIREVAAAVSALGAKASLSRIDKLSEKASGDLLAAGFETVDYVAVRDAGTLGIPEAAKGRPLRVLAAAWLGKTRLIDNVAVE